MAPRHRGKPPDVVVEIVSPTKGGEDTDKLRRYAQFGVPYYVIFDPDGVLSAQPLRLFHRGAQGYLLYDERMFPPVGLGVTPWRGSYEGQTETWLRWTDLRGNLIPTGAERAEAERARAEAERVRAEAEKSRADQLAAELERLRESLREQGG